MRELISVDSYIRRKAEERRIDALQLTGIACPKCGYELQWTGPILTSLPPKRRVECTGFGCDYANYLPC